jgi:hypothetical protein
LLIVGALAAGCSPKGSGTSGAGNGSSSNGSGNGVSTSCTTPGATQACCGSGTQTCAGGEFATWGACLAADGSTLTCGQGDCASGEFNSCDGGAPPSPPSLPPMPALCTPGDVNNEPEILVGYAPANNQSVGLNGQIKVWVNDEGASIIAPGELVDAATGAIVTPGDRTAKAPDGYLWEPALYIAPQSAENGGTPHFPIAIHGDYNGLTQKKSAGVHVAGMEPPPAGAMLTEAYTTEFVWDVAALGLAPATYLAEFVIHDGDHDRAVGCVVIRIDPIK